MTKIVLKWKNAGWTLSVPIFGDEALLQQFGTVELQRLVRGDAVVDEDVHAAVLADDVAQGVADLVAERRNPPSSG